jgi:hypothetical protein
MKANIFIAITSIVLAAGAALYAYSTATDNVTESQRIFADAQQKVNEEVGRETAALNKNFDILKSTTATTDQRTAAVKELQKTYPDYLRNVNLEGASLTALTEIQGQLNSQILKGVAERQKAIAVEGQYNKVAQAQLRITQLRQQGFAALSGEEVKTAGRSLFGTDFEKSFVQAGARAEVVADVIKALENDVKNATKTAGELATQFDTTFGIGEKSSKKSFDALTNQRQAIEDAKDALEDMTPAQREALKFSEQWDARWAQMEKGGKESFSGAKRSADLYKNALASINAVVEKGDVLGADVMHEQAREIESQIERLIEGGFKPYSKEVENLRNMLKGLREDAAKGFTVQNKTQQELGISATPTAFPSLDIPGQVVSIDTTSAEESVADLKELQNAAIDFIDQKRQEAHEKELARAEEEKAAKQQVFDAAISTASTIADSILTIQRARAEEEKGILDEEYAAKFEAAQGNAALTEKLQQELAGKKEAIDKEVARKEQRIAIGKALIDTALAVTKALSSTIPPFNFALAGLASAAGLAQVGAIKAQKFAEGGVVHGPTLGLVGEYPGAANNPEIIAPENKLTSIFSKELGKSEANLAKVVNDISATIVQEKSSAALTNISNAISNLASNVTNNRSDVQENRSNVTNNRSDVQEKSSAALTNISNAISNLASSVTNNRSDVQDNSSNVTNNRSDVQENRSNVTNNRSDVQEKSSDALTNISNAISNLASNVTNNRSDVQDNSGASSSTSNSLTNNTYNVFNSTTQGDKEQNTFAQTSQKFAQIKIPAFATGGVIKTPTLGLMGEYANASTNPEIIAPENKLRQIYREESAGAGGGELVAIVRGDDLHFILDKASKRRGRVA